MIKARIYLRAYCDVTLQVVVASAATTPSNIALMHQLCASA
jgi:hypothetical protein